ncbi:hypothetical protein ROBYS_20020 [Roseobacter sp. OBYS 0001]|nr:hypothetical protein ROBYS_20020 [Roseobacter sp. OBYS 0001]
MKWPKAEECRLTLGFEVHMPRVLDGELAEWLRSGLQSRLHFERKQKLSLEKLSRQIRNAM